jgi:hypothetical protein
VEVVDEDHRDDGYPEAVSAVLSKEGRADSPDDEGDEHAAAGPDEQRAAAETVDEEGGAGGGPEVEDLEEAVDQGLGVWVCDADGLGLR